MTQYKCVPCDRIYDALPQDDLCEDCGRPLEPVKRPKSAKKEQLLTTTALSSGLIRGLGVAACDISQSMEERAFPNESALVKLDLVVDALQRAIQQMRDLQDKEDAYLAIIAFGRRAKLITDRQGRPFVKSVAEILAEEGDQLAAYLSDQFENDRCDVDRGATNITDALRLAREVADAALAGSLAGFGVPQKLAIKTQPVVRPGKASIEIPNIRVMAYSDGAHNEGPFENAFASFEPASILMCAFMGDEKANDEARLGADQMKALANICPEHDRKGYFLINGLGRRAFLRELYHMGTGNSGFCPQCMISKADGLGA